MKLKIIILGVLLLLCSTLQAQMYWQQPVINYSRQEYGGANQSWKVVQAPNGWIYFANNMGLLEYDGVYWNIYPMPHNTKLRSLHVAHDGRIYVGGQRVFGYYSPNKQGRLVFTNLSARFQPKEVTNIWNILSVGGKIYFQGDANLFCLQKDKITRINCDGAALSAVVGKHLYVYNSFGLSIVSGNKTVNLKNTNLKGASVSSLLSYHGKPLLATRDQGFYLYDNGSIKRVFTHLKTILAGHKVSCAAISGSKLTIGTSDDGVFIADLNSSRCDHIGIANGLQNASVLSMAFDRDANLWLGLDNGIDYIPLRSSLYFLYSKLSSIGAGYCSALLGHGLFLGTNQGVYRSSIPVTSGQAVTLSPLEGMSGQVHCMYPYQGELFCGGRMFFAATDGNRINKFATRGVWNVHEIGNGNTLVLGTYWGLRILRKTNNRWAISKVISGTDISAKTMFVEPESNIVWVANKTDGIWRITLNAPLTHVLHKKNYNNHLLPKGDNVCIAKIGADIVVASRMGLFRYDDRFDRLEPFTKLETRLDGHRGYTFIRQDSHGNIWYVCGGIMKILPKGRKSIQTVIAGNLMEDFENVSLLTPRIAVIGTEDGFVLVDQNQAHRPSRITLQIRKLHVTNRGDSVAYWSNGFEKTQPDISLRYSENSIRIDYGANNFGALGTETYSYRLRGLNDNWSDYTTSTTKEFTNLHEGTYIFEVRTLATNGQPGAIARIQFTVLPPWYRSWWAMIIYVIAIGYFFFSIYKRYREKLRERDRHIEEKEKQIDEQQRSIEEKKQEIKDLEEEKLRTELQNKSDELMKTTLNIVRKNEILQRIRQEATSLSKNAKDGDAVGLKRGLVRLIGQIDVNMEHDSDLKSFSSSFDAVHHDFFKKLDALHPNLTHKEKMLCAYVRMNLMSKEIAPLLNISVRGVEISRYRIRRKLGLDEGVNLFDYLQKI